jgi:hypothetical protein
MLEGLIFFCADGRPRDQAGLHTRIASAGPHECWSVSYFALRADCVIFRWAEHAQRAIQAAMNVGASHLFFCVRGPTAWIQAAHAHRPAGPHERWSVLHFFCVDRSVRGIQAGCTSLAPRVGPHENWSRLICFALRADRVDSGWLDTRIASSRPHECWSLICFLR